MRNRIPRLLAPLIALALLWAPSVALACSQCLATRTRANQLAFILTTVFLSVTPLLVIGGIVYWLRTKLREADHSSEPAISEATPTSTS